jgi:glycosyltransferase involved in cell wall biosynthesis
MESKYDRKSVLIPNGVEVPVLETGSRFVGELGLAPGKYVLHVGRLVPEKRHLDLIAAYRESLPTDWKLAIVGRLADDTYSQAVRDAANEAGVVLTGFLNGLPLREMYSHAGAFVLPSSHEGLPIALLEALSFGVPTFASDIPSNVSIGLSQDSYFPLGDRSALARLLRTVYSTPRNDTERERRRQWVSEHYDWDAIADQTYVVYANLVGPKS